jgi:hypothetical protein
MWMLKDNPENFKSAIVRTGAKERNARAVARRFSELSLLEGVVTFVQSASALLEHT